MWQETITIDGPYDFDRVLERLMINPLNDIEIESKRIKVPLIINNQPEVATVQATGSLNAPRFLITSSACEQVQVVNRLAAIFQWNKSLTDIHTHFQHTKLQPIFAEHIGTPLILDFDPYSCLMKCIIHQQLNMKFAHVLTERFVHTFGFQKQGVWFYPEPEKVAQLTVAELRELQFSGRKAEYVIGISELIANGQIIFDELKMCRDEDIFESLVKIRGIGPWTVQNFLLFGLGRPNLFPSGDIGIQNAIKKLFEMDRKPTQAEMVEMATEWQPFLSYASLYLWRSIE